MGGILIPGPAGKVSFIDYFKKGVLFYAPLSGGKPSDIGPSKYTGTVSGALVSGAGPPHNRRRGSYYFNGVDNYIDYGAINPFPYLKSWTFSAWAKADDGGNGRRLATADQGASSTYMDVYWGGQGFNFSEYGSGGWSGDSVTGLKIGQWYHVMESYNHPGAMQWVYIDGRLVCTKSFNRDVGYGATYNFRIGSNPNNSAPAYQWMGNISEVGILNRYIGEREAFDFYKETAGKKRLWTAGNYADAAGGSAVPVFQANYSRKRRAA